MSAPTSAEAAQAKLLARLAAPLTRQPVEIVAQETAHGAIRRGAIFNRADGRRIGRIEDFQIDFVRPGEGEARAAPPIEVAEVAEWRLVPHSAEEIAYAGPKIALPDYEMIAVEEPGGSIAFNASGEIELSLFAHPWSGIVEVAYAGERITLDLYAPHTVIPHPLALDLGGGRQRVVITPTGRQNPLSGGGQCLFGGFRIKTGRLIPLRHAKQAKVRGAAFTPAFYELLSGVPAHGVLLDIGGGNRQFDDSRYVNLDYADYDEPDLIADATRLPLADGCIDAVYSTGVFEHIKDPARAGAEVARVLKAGGKAIIGWAFMQPIHSEGQHFYNATPWGVEQAFAALKPKRFWYETSLAFLLRWGASASGLAGRVPAAEIDALCETLQTWDALIPETHKQYMANGVWAEFDKPAAK